MPREPQTDALGRFLTVAETAEVLNVSLNQVYSLVRSGELPAIRVGAGNRWRVERAQLEAYIEAGYEESRRRAHWHQTEFAILPELRSDLL